MGNKAYLVLENGKVFCGESFGAAGEVTAEVVFTTGMTGYLETLTDKSYFGQIVVQTFPLIGNYGVIPSDFEGKIIGPCGYIVKEWCQSPSNFRSEGDLDTFLKKEASSPLRHRYTCPHKGYPRKRRHERYDHNRAYACRYG